MARIIFTSIMVLHGLLHLLGWVNAWNLASHAQLSHKAIIDPTANVQKVTGLFWLLACILFLAAGFLYLARRDWFWIVAIAGIVISQVLIINQWQDAKYGTIINLVILVAVIVSAAVMYFNKKVRHEIADLTNQAATSQQVLTASDIRHLPENVQRWLYRSDVVGKTMPTTIHVTQKGVLRTQPGGRWMPFNAHQYFSIDPPGFVWQATIRATPFFHIAGRDKYLQGHGNMVIKPLSLFTAANSSGKKIDQGTLLRYMAEMAWFPQSAVSKFVRWEGIDANKARATLDYQGVSASGVFHFNEEGLVQAFEARRYGEFDGIYRKETWLVAVTGYKIFNGTTIGYKNDVTWKLKEGDFHWLTMEVTDVQAFTNLEDARKP